MLLPKNTLLRTLITRKIDARHIVNIPDVMATETKTRIEPNKIFRNCEPAPPALDKPAVENEFNK